MKHKFLIWRWYFSLPIIIFLLAILMVSVQLSQDCCSFYNVKDKTEISKLCNACCTTDVNCKVKQFATDHKLPAWKSWILCYKIKCVHER